MVSHRDKRTEGLPLGCHGIASACLSHPAVLTLGRWKCESQEFKVTLCYQARSEAGLGSLSQSKAKSLSEMQVVWLMMEDLPDMLSPGSGRPQHC